MTWTLSVCSWLLPVPPEPPGQCLVPFLASRPREGSGSVLSSVLLPFPEGGLAELMATPTTSSNQEVPSFSGSPQDLQASNYE